MSWLTELRNNREDADVTLHCQEDVIMAHSFILKNRYLITSNSCERDLLKNFPQMLFSFHHFYLSRSAYFKTKLTTLVGDLNNVVKVEECTSFVLAKVLDFMYDIKLPAELSYEDAKSLLAMADLYMMDDLKDVAGSFLADRHLANANILEISKVADKYTATKLRERCCEFIFSNHASLDKKVLTELYKTLPNLGEMAWQEILSNGRPVEGAADILKKVLGIDLTKKFKKRRDFQSEDDYMMYVMANIKPNMLVLRNTEGRFYDQRIHTLYTLSTGAMGKITKIDFTDKKASVQWFDVRGKNQQHQITSLKDPTNVTFVDLNLLTSPVSVRDEMR